MMKHPLRWLVLGLAHVLVFATVGPKLVQRLEPYHLFEILGKDHPTAMEYRDYVSRYKDENWVHILVEKKEKLITEIYALDRAVVEKLVRLPGLEKVESLVESQWIEYRNEENAGRFFLKRFFEEGKLRPQGQALLNQEPLWKNGFVSQDEKAILVKVKLRDQDSAIQMDTIGEILSIAKRVEMDLGDVSIHVLGPKVASFYFNEELEKHMRIVSPISFLIILLVLFYFFETISSVLFGAYILTTTFLLTGSAILFFEKALNPYTNFALLFVFVVSIEDLIHFLAVYGQKAHLKLEERVKSTVSELRVPCFYTMLTEWIGFASLSLSTIDPIRNFGIYSSFGVAVAYGLTFFVVPRFLIWLKIPMKVGSPDFLWVPKGYDRFVGFFNKFGRRILILTVALVVVSAAWITQLKVDDRFYHKFTSGHPMSRAVSAFQEHLGYTGTLDLVFDLPHRALLNLENEVKLNSIQTRVAEHPNVIRVGSLLNTMKYFRSVTERPLSSNASFETDSDLRHVFDEARHQGLLKDMWSKDAQETRWVIGMRDVSSSALADTAARIEKELKDEGIPFRFTGYGFIRMKLLDEIIWGFITSFGTTFLLIFAVFFWQLKSLKLATIAMIPNVVPVILIAGGLGAFGVEVDDSVVLTVSVFLGIAVNDTIHFLHTYLATRDLGETFRMTGRAVIQISLAVILVLPCFFLTGISMFHKIAVLFALGVLLALFCDLVLLPAILSKRVRDV